MEHNEYVKLQEQLQQHFDSRYRKVTDCDDIVDTIEQNVNKDNVRLAVIEQQNKLLLWIAGVEATGIMTILIKMFI